MILAAAPRRLIAACTFIVCSAVTGYGAQFGDFTYVEYDTYIQITDYPESASGDVIIPGWIVGKPVTSIGVNAFSDCTNLTSVTIPDSVTTIGGNAFADCRELTSVTISESVTSVGYQVFRGCIGLTSVAIPDGVTSIGNGAFWGCISLTSVTIPDSVTSIGDFAFYNCNLASVTIPGNVTEIGDATFSNCTLTSVIIPNGATSIGDNAFKRCFQLTSVTIPDSVISIGDRAFYYCYSLASVTIPDKVTRIGTETFWGCSGLTTVIIPDSITTIEDAAFARCGNLHSIFFEGDTPLLGETVFTATNAIIYYLPGTTGWGSSYGGRPTAEISVLPDPLIDGIPIIGSEGWFLSEWFGYYSASHAPWLFHAQHGFIYRYPDSTHTSLYFYDNAMGAWWWTNGDFYPLIFVFDPPPNHLGTDIGSEWIYYFEQSVGPRSFGVVTGDLAGEILYFGP